MLKKMCHGFLNGADIREIRKNRDFATGHAASGDLIESLFLTGSGMEAAISSLSRDELIILHLMRFKGDAEDVPFFTRIYRSENSSMGYGATYNERYRDIYKKIMSSLVHKGLLLATYFEERYGKTKLERVRFRFPAAFGGFLPSLFDSTSISDLPGEKGRNAARQKILEIIDNKDVFRNDGEEGYHMNIKDGVLRIGEQRFSLKYLRKWQEESWRKAAWTAVKPDKQAAGNPIEAVTYIISQLKDNEWLGSDQLSKILKIFLYGYASPEAEVICKTGLEWGCLKSLTINGKTCYRLSGLESLRELDPAVYMATGDGGAVIIDPEKIPFETLEFIADISDMQLGDSMLVASPSVKKLGRRWRTVPAHPASLWLKEHSRAFRKAFDTVAERWGRTVIHKNIKVARIRDLGLKVKIEKAVDDPRKLVVLNDEFIAFTADLLGSIEKLVRKEGSVIKVVKAG